jgi:hypothetical protein
MKQVRTVRQPATDCRWRIWRAYGSGAQNLATREAAEHICGGEFLWIARETSDGTTWMLDERPVTLMEVIDHVPPAMAEWVIDQTLAGLGGSLVEMLGIEPGADGEISVREIDGGERGQRLEDLAGLMSEFMVFAHAGSIVADKLDAIHELVERERGGQAGDDERAAA